MKLALLTSALLSIPIAAQGLHIIPNHWANADAPAMLGLGGVGTTERQQILIDPSQLTDLIGRRITGLAFRRDVGDVAARAPMSGAVVIRLGIAAAAWDRASPAFATNLPTSVETYRGPVLAPSSPTVTTGSVGWSAPNAVEITFQTGFDYTGGTLCVEIDGTSSQPGWWPIDAIEDVTSGTVTSDGVACGARAQVLGQTAFVAAADLVIGRTAVCKFFGEPGSAAICLVGADTLPTPIDLRIAGAPGCWLYVLPVADIPTPLSSELANTPFGGIANVNLHLPSQTALLSATFAVQWIELLQNSIATSNALRCSIAGSAPSLGMAVVWQRPGGQPVVDSNRAPVIGLRAQ